ncbi:MAG TPA: GntR family transcriptional regulator [Candidatus Eisenbacteria bacterium]|nr:GntR family transcriptional regulator [Candidatus Eisenbacteria bacterium]
MAAAQVRPIVRIPIRSEVRRILLEGMLRGDPAPGAPINESELSGLLGVSRTPLREALLGLVGEGFLRASPGRGFFVLPLSAKEVEHLYPIIAALEGLALRSSPRPSVAEIRRLNDINQELALERDNWKAALHADERWHEALLSRCGNERLLETIRMLKYHAQRYESAYMRHSGTIIQSVAQHRAILRALRAGDMEAAARFLDANWKISQDFLLPWLRNPELAPTPSKRKRARRT